MDDAQETTQQEGRVPQKTPSPEGRIRTLTEKGLEYYEQQRDTLSHQLGFSQKMLEECLKDLENDFPRSAVSIDNAESSLKSSNDRYSDSANRYIDFLSRYNTPEANLQREQYTSDPAFKGVEKKVRSMFDQLTDAKTKFLEMRSSRSSVTSKRSHMSSVSSSTSNLAAKKRAEAESAKAKLIFAQQEAVLKKEQNNINVELELLAQKKDFAAKEAEASYLEKHSYSAPNSSSGGERELSCGDHGSSYKLPPELSASERTEKYVQSLNINDVNRDIPHVSHSENRVLNPLATVYIPPNGNRGNQSENTIAQYLCRKDILKDRLHSFNGKYEHYIAWKDTFISVMIEIGASAAEELDLLLRWAGSGSKQVNSIKTANSGNPVLGLARAWERLDSQYGSPERIEQALRIKLNNVSRITFKDKTKMYELSDILSEILAVKEKPQYQTLLSYLDTAAGVNPTINKLPPGLQNKWRDRALSYKRSKNVLFPPFAFLCDFVHDMAVTYNDPSFDFSDTHVEPCARPARQRQVSVAKTNTADVTEIFPCLIHIYKNGHSLNDCRTFRHKTLEERKQLLKQKGVCFRCCAGRHLRKDCDRPIKCEECNDNNHSTALHVYKTSNRQTDRNNGGEKTTVEKSQPGLNVDSLCTELCNDVHNPGKSCAKIVLVNIRNQNIDLPPIRAYAIIDDQSNYSLAKPELFDQFNVRTAATPYSLKSCGGRITLDGRRASGFIVESIDGLEHMELPTLTECDMIPDNRNEIPTPQVASTHPHLACIADSIPPIDEDANILLLIGRDVMPAHYILDQKLGSENQPFAQRLKLGWVIIGECCLDGAHVPQDLSSMKTYLHSNGRPSMMAPCENAFSLKNAFEGEMLFETTTHDNKLGLSCEDKQFNQLMSTEMQRNAEGNWVAPLPFKQPRPYLPNNRQYAARRTHNYLASLKKHTQKKEDTLDFMEALLNNGHAERVHNPDPTVEVWYLPLFGVYHPKKDRIRIVFDSSAKYGGLSLNDVLMTGPNLTNNLLGVLMRFRKDKVAVIADIQQMFYSFLVRPDHRNYLRFVWPEDNDLDKELVDYRMNVHVFGNSPSPAVATYGLHKIADIAEPSVGTDVKQFVKRNFYVDDALSSHPTSDKAIDLLRRTQNALQDYGNLRLHKVCSNSREVLAAFNKEDLAKDLKDLDLDSDFPLQRSLGVCWNIQSDTFTFSVAPDDNAFTRRGVLSTINGLYDPLGLAAAFTITGKLLLRESNAEKLDWDEPLPREFLGKWQTWKKSLDVLKYVQVPRMYCNVAASDVKHRDLYVYSDASEKAVAAAAYMVTTDKCGNQQLGFVLGKAKVAPKHGHTIPRLELCGAVLAVELYEICRDELDIDFGRVLFFTDSKVVLGYLSNQTKRFYIYVGNRVDRIRNSTSPDQWNYVPSSLNPADDATRGVTAEDLTDSKWLKGPIHVLDQGNDTHQEQQPFPLVFPEEDREVRTLKTELSKSDYLGCQRFERFSSWTSVIRGVSVIKSRIRSYPQQPSQCDPVANRKQAQNIVIRNLQLESFPKEIVALRDDLHLPKDSRIRNLSPYLDSDGILRVGGRLNNARLEPDLAHPIIVPQHHLSTLLVRHFHEKTHHQGRHLTEGAIRSAGFWILGCKRQVTACIRNCFHCRKSRGKTENPKMSDLPLDRLDPTPPFTNVGIDVFGPWEISARRTRGGHANSKRWALIFTCLVVRAVHIELLEEMSSSCFINALRRFCALRGELESYDLTAARTLLVQPLT